MALDVITSLYGLGPVVADGGVLLVESVGLVPVGGCAIAAADINTVKNKKEILEKDNCIVIVLVLLKIRKGGV